MNKTLICLAGLATVLLSQPALAINETWSGATPGYRSDYQPGYRPDRELNTLRPTPIGTPQPSGSSQSSISPSPDRLLVPSAEQPPIGVTNSMPNVIPSEETATLPPPPQQNPSPTPAPVNPVAPAPIAPSPLPVPSQQPTPSFNSSIQSATPIPSQLGLDFDLSGSSKPLPAPAPPLPKPPTSNLPQPPIAPVPASAQADAAPASSAKPEFTLKDLFNGNSDSIVAVIVGNAEGTRRPDGGANKAFYGHTDPGNGVWNLGTFSYQHGADSPEEADTKQLNRLKQQSRIMQEKAAEKGLKLTLEETLNGIDLANQAPQAVIDTDGYIEWLAKAHAMGMQDEEAILWARVQSFINPHTQQWDAPGLGNTPDSISRDQKRRMEAIANAIDAQNYAISPDARLRPQPIGFRIPGFFGMVRQLTQKTVAFLGFG